MTLRVGASLKTIKQTIAKQKQIVISDRIRKGSNDPIRNHYQFGPLADDGDMDTDEGTVRRVLQKVIEKQ